MSSFNCRMWCNICATHLSISNICSSMICTHWQMEHFSSSAVSGRCCCIRPSLQSWHPPLPLLQLASPHRRALLADRHLCWGAHWAHLSSIPPWRVNWSLCAWWDDVSLWWIFVILFSDCASERGVDWHCDGFRLFDGRLEVGISGARQISLLIS